MEHGTPGGMGNIGRGITLLLGSWVDGDGVGDITIGEAGGMKGREDGRVLGG